MPSCKMKTASKNLTVGQGKLRESEAGRISQRIQRTYQPANEDAMQDRVSEIETSCPYSGSRVTNGWEGFPVSRPLYTSNLCRAAMQWASRRSHIELVPCPVAT
jgi:hypothetical protein